MRSFVPFILAASLLLTVSARAEDADELAAKGIAALKLSQNEPDAIVSAAIFLGQAKEIYEAKKDDAKAQEMNSDLYWCKKKMTLQQMEAFLKGGDAINAKIAQRMKEIEAAPPADEAQTYFNRAEAYANAHPNEHLLIAVRFYEVADRFKGSDLSLQAQDRLLKEITLEKTGAANSGASARENPATAPVDPAKKVALPAAAKQKEALKTIKDLYKEEFAKSAPKDKAALAAKLDKQADESAGDPAARYVLLTQAAALAAQAGELERLTGILDKLAAGFESDFKDFKKAQLSAAMSKITDAKLAKVASALKVLIDKPDDAAANLTLGKYKLQAGDIEHAAAFISKSKNAAFISLIKQELSAPQDATAQYAVGDAIWESGDKAADNDDRVLCHARAAYWYAKAVQSLTGLAKAKVEKRLDEAVAAMPRKITDVLKLIDPARDAVNGEWKLVDGALECTKSIKSSRIQFPNKIGAEYDLHIVMALTSKDSDPCVILPCCDQQVLLCLCGFGGSTAVLQHINGTTDNNETRRTNTMQMGMDYDLLVQVRKNSIRVILNKKDLIYYRFDYPRFSLFVDWELRDSHATGLYLQRGTARFRTIEVTEVPTRASLAAP
ncbi:MAG TPA: hypothetical protein VKX17_12435 [Planctomycetota bacterium]|nr:hypothetical protein [Planctomycetota bacterium]